MLVTFHWLKYLQQSIHQYVRFGLLPATDWGSQVFLSSRESKKWNWLGVINFTSRLFEICSTSLVVLIRNFPLFCNFPMSMSTKDGDVEQISSNRVINQESHVYFVKFGMNLPRSFLKIFKSPQLCSGRFQKFQKTNSVHLSQISQITMWLLVPIIFAS